jgi:hypothetical protein
MHPVYHRAVTAQALGGQFTQRALGRIVAANLAQDLPAGQIGHPEYHFDDNAFSQSWAYIERNRARARTALEGGHPGPAWAALGRLTHAAQDLYAHSNYVSLWLARFSEGEAPPPQAIDPFDEELFHSPALRSGKVDYFFEFLAFVPPLRKFAKSRLPHDAHAWMNLDVPERGPLFAYALAAALKRTAFEYRQTVRGLPPEILAVFHG